MEHDPLQIYQAKPHGKSVHSILLKTELYHIALSRIFLPLEDENVNNSVAMNLDLFHVQLLYIGFGDITYNFQSVWRPTTFHSYKTYLNSFLLFQYFPIFSNLGKTVTSTMTFLFISFTQLHTHYVTVTSVRP